MNEDVSTIMKKWWLFHCYASLPEGTQPLNIPKTSIFPEVLGVFCVFLLLKSDRILPKESVFFCIFPKHHFFEGRSSAFWGMYFLGHNLREGLDPEFMNVFLALFFPGRKLVESFNGLFFFEAKINIIS